MCATAVELPTQPTYYRVGPWTPGNGAAFRLRHAPRPTIYGKPATTPKPAGVPWPTSGKKNKNTLFGRAAVAAWSMARRRPTIGTSKSPVRHEQGPGPLPEIDPPPRALWHARRLSGRSTCRGPLGDDHAGSAKVGRRHTRGQRESDLNLEPSGWAERPTRGSPLSKPLKP